MGVLIPAVVGLSILALGCGKPPRLLDSDDKESRQKGDLWEAAAKRLRKEADLKTCKAVLGTLNQELSAAEKSEKPAELSQAAEEKLAALVPLHPTDRAEIRSGSFTPHDPVYLADCLYLRDAAQSLAIAGLSNEQLADVGFAWVCRQVMLEPWIVELYAGAPQGTALPPVQVLRRGYGSGLERMYVFLALLQQMGLKGCLIGPPTAPRLPAPYVAYTPDKKTVLTGSPRGPFWVVGVLMEKDKKPDIKLYDPWRGEALPATWNELRANPASHAAWFNDPATVSGLKADDLKTAAVCLAVPVNALASRMALLEKKLKELVHVRLALDPDQYRSAFGETGAVFWNPPEDKFAYGRAARTFLPVDQGGEADRADPSGRYLFERYNLSLLPSPERVLPADLVKSPTVMENVKPRIEETVRGVYYFAFIQPPTPRELLQRGQFQDASRALVQRQDEFARSLLRVRNTEEAEKKMRDWVDTAMQLYSSLGSDRAANDAIRANIDEHWHSPAAGLVLDRAVGEVGQAEAVYLLALCRHEQAERAQARLDHASGGDLSGLRRAASDAWDTALREWNGYREQFTSAHAGNPARAGHVRTLAERAKKLAGKR